jgi:predicted nucleic acid-binding protein
MESFGTGLVRGIVADSSILITAERGKLSTTDVIRSLRQAAGNVPIAICALTIAELGHGVYHAATAEKAKQRRQFLDEIKQYVPVHPITGATAELVAQIGGEQALRGITIPLADLIIGACAIELGYAVATHNVRHFRLIPGLDVRKY